MYKACEMMRVSSDVVVEEVVSTLAWTVTICIQLATKQPRAPATLRIGNLEDENLDLTSYFISQPWMGFLHGCEIKSGWRPGYEVIWRL